MERFEVEGFERFLKSSENDEFWWFYIHFLGFQAQIAPTWRGNDTGWLDNRVAIY